jgi:hypothetical protein
LTMASTPRSCVSALRSSTRTDKHQAQ